MRPFSSFSYNEMVRKDVTIVSHAKESVSHNNNLKHKFVDDFDT